MTGAHNWREARVTVIGLGIEGVDLVRFLSAEGARVTVSDARTAAELPDSLDDQQKRSKIRNLTYELAHRTKVIENITGARGSAARWVIKTNPS